MAVRPFSFGLRLRDKDRTVRVRARGKNGDGFVVEDEQLGRETRRRVHHTAQSAVKDTASTWRMRLN
jgi:hypothetical protein